MKIKISFFATMAFMLFANLSKAQTSVYVCSKTGAYGYCYGNNNVSNCAYNKCIENGGKSPSSVYATNSKGYGAIAVGTSSDGAQIVGAAAGYSNSEGAKNRAIQECSNRGGKNISITETFLDN